MGEVDIHQRTFQFACRIVKLCRELDQQPGAPRTLANQLLRSGTSVGANVEEAQAGQSKKDFTAKMYIACKEARETNYWLRLLGETGIVPAIRLTDLTEESRQLVAILTTIVKKARG